MSMQNQLQKLAEAAAAHESSAAVGRLKRLFDEGTFVELDRFSCDEAAIGYGTVDGSPVYAFAQNCEVCCGAVGKAQAAKIRQVYALAEQNGAPVVGLFDSDGAKLGEGLDAMDALAEILLISNRISGVVPQIAVVAGACVGSAALVAANADITVAVDGADYYLKPDEKGSAAVAAADVDEAIDKVRGLLALLPSNNLTVAPAYVLMCGDGGGRGRCCGSGSGRGCRFVRAPVCRRMRHGGTRPRGRHSLRYCRADRRRGVRRCSGADCSVCPAV